MLDNNITTEKKKLTVGLRTIITILAIVIVIVGIVFVLRLVGKSQLSKAIAGERNVDVGESSTTLSENQILYKGKVYQLNEDLISVLVMGIDSETVEAVGGQSWKADDTVNNGGQADTLFLTVINPHTKEISFVAINRNTMADVDVWDDEGNYTGVVTQQISLQHGYGDGGVESCERQVKAVSRMLFNIPINSYVAISMDGVPKLNDAIGGVDVTVLDDIVYPEYNMNLHTGENVTLKGKTAYWYVRLRNENAFNSNQLRLDRQKQYLKAFINKAKEKSLSDIRIALDLYKTMGEYMVTDIDLSTFTYMATEYLNYDFDLDNIYTLEGETINGTQFEEFYMDEDAAEEMIVNLFYEEVK